MADSYHHGVRVLEVTTGARTVRTVATAVVGLVATGDAADATLFPLNKPVLITDVQGSAGLAGATGTLQKALLAIADQTNPVTVVVRVAEGDTDAETNTNVIGSKVGSVYTGMQALLAAEAQLGVKPRILGCPGLDTEAVTTAMVVVAQKLRGFVYASAGTAATVEAATTYREGFGARELMIIWPDFLSYDTTAGAAEPSYAVARALGLRAKIDKDVGWHKTLSNVAVNGVTGISRDVHWDLQDPDTDAGLLNAADVTTLVRSNGFRFWGSRTCSDETAFQFENYTRTAQIMADTMAEGVAQFVDAPMTPTLIKDIVETINAKLRAWAGEYIIDGKCWYDPASNDVATLSAGSLRLDYDYTPVPPLEDLQLAQRITSSYLANFASAIAAN